MEFFKCMRGKLSIRENTKCTKRKSFRVRRRKSKRGSNYSCVIILFFFFSNKGKESMHLRTKEKKSTRERNLFLRHTTFFFLKQGERKYAFKGRVWKKINRDCRGEVDSWGLSLPSRCVCHLRL